MGGGQETAANNRNVCIRLWTSFALDGSDQGHGSTPASDKCAVRGTAVGFVVLVVRDGAMGSFAFELGSPV